MFLIAFLTLIAALITWYQVKYRHRNLLFSKIPTPVKYPVIHNTHLLYGKSPIEVFKLMTEMSVSVAPVHLITMTPFDNGTVVVSDPKVAEGIVSSQKILNKSEDYERLKVWLGTGLLISTGKKWFKRRKIITPSFHFQILEKFVEIMDEQGQVLISKLRKLEGKEVDIFPLVNLYALDVICESAMGCKMNAQSNEDLDYVQAVKGMSHIIFERSYNPILQIEFLYKFTKMYQDERKCLKNLHSFTDGVIKARRDELLKKTEEESLSESSGIKKKEALLDILLKSSIDGVALTNSDIREEVDTFMFEGHDTTTSAISFCLHNIAKYPEVQKQVFEEIQNEVGSSEKALTLQNLNNLHYLDLVIKESLRLYPSVPFYGRKLSEEVTVGGYTFPKKCDIVISAFMMNRNPETFPDPETFNPSRFDVETTAEKINPYAYVPFSAGPRNCIGQKFAVYEMKSIISKIVKNFELSVSKENENLEVYSDLVLKSVGGIKLKINKRR